MDFSGSLEKPTSPAPGSFPPWPGSMTIVLPASGLAVWRGLNFFGGVYFLKELKDAELLYVFRFEAMLARTTESLSLGVEYTLGVYCSSEEQPVKDRAEIVMHDNSTAATLKRIRQLLFCFLSVFGY